MKLFLICIILLCFSISCRVKKTIEMPTKKVYPTETIEQKIENSNNKFPVFDGEKMTSTGKGKNKTWTDSILSTLTLDQKIGQLFMVAAYSNRGEQHKIEISNLIKQYQLGGLIWMQGGPVRQVNLLNYYQSISNIPLINSIDGEWGLAMRLDSTPRFPKQMTLGALANDSIIYEMGSEIAYQCKRVGLQINFAPVVDINSNSNNPVISNRSFGEIKEDVAQKSILYMLGMQNNKVLACAKHFPGHGDTDSDSHLTLPVVGASKQRIDSLELYPFKKLMEHGLGSVMVAHLHIPAIDTIKNAASTLSTKVVTDLLQNQLQFKGLIFTDALNMKGVANYFSANEINFKALLAGNDVLLFADDIPATFTKIKDAITQGTYTEKELDKHVHKILQTKEWSGVNKFIPIETKHLVEDLNNDNVKSIIQYCIKNSITLLKNKDNIIPLTKLDTLKVATIAINTNGSIFFQQRISNYVRDVTHATLRENFSQPEMENVLNNIADKNLIMINVVSMSNKPDRQFGLGYNINELISCIPNDKKIILSVYGNPYSLAYLYNNAKIDAIIMAYQDSDPTQDVVAQVIAGAQKAQGKLPVNVDSKFKLKQGITSTSLNKIQYALPSDVGANSFYLAKIDSMCNDIVNNGTTPGCQVLAMKDGKVFYQKSFGYHTYEKKQKVNPNDLYDLASLTKILASMPVLLNLHSSGQLTLDTKLNQISPKIVGNKSELSLRELLAHQSGLPAWIPFYTSTLKDKSIYNSNYSATHMLKVANNMYLKTDYSDSIFLTIYNCKLSTPVKYVYSDLGYYLIKKAVESYGVKSYSNFLNTNYYARLGLGGMTYNPLQKFKLSEIVPTENDTIWRKQLVHGYVHDQGAAMLGGEAGHAGLFANATDIATMMQLYLQKGAYGGDNYFNNYTWNEFNKIQFPLDGNRRGAAIDKPDFNNTTSGPCTSLASAKSFGHSGFTGTYTWADPENNLVYVFLSNRVYPSSDNKKLIQDNVRTKIHEYFYMALEK